MVYVYNHYVWRPAAWNKAALRIYPSPQPHPEIDPYF